MQSDLKFQVPFDGTWIDMNEVYNGCDGDCTGDRTPKLPWEMSNWHFMSFWRLSKLTEIGPDSIPTIHLTPYTTTVISENLCKYLFRKFREISWKSHGKFHRSFRWKHTFDMDAVHYGGRIQYNVHSIHGYMEAMNSKQAMENIKKERALGKLFLYYNSNSLWSIFFLIQCHVFFGKNKLELYRSTFMSAIFFVAAGTLHMYVRLCRIKTHLCGFRKNEERTMIHFEKALDFWHL